MISNNFLAKVQDLVGSAGIIKKPAKLRVDGLIFDLEVVYA